MFSALFLKDRICHILSPILESSEQFKFDSDGSSVIVDNSENAHILSEEYMFTDNIYYRNSNGVATIGVKDINIKGIGKIRWSCNDDEGKLHTQKLNNILNLPYSPVNILSAIALTESMRDDDLKWVLTKSKYSIFT